MVSKPDPVLHGVGHSKGDRVRITMSGKFLPYKYYGGEQGLPGTGLKED
jgi:cyanate lyase